MPSYRNLASWLIWLSGISTLARKFLVAKGKFVLEFHGIPRKHYPVIPSEIQPRYSAAEFEKVLGWVQKHFSFLSPDQFFNSDKRGVLLTFDDGLANNYTVVLPILENFSAPAIFFCTTAHLMNSGEWLPATRELVKKYWAKEEDVPVVVAADLFNSMSREQILACAANPLITIGSHTVSHPFLTQCDPAEVKYELTASRRFLRDLTQQPINYFAYPSGDYDQMVKEAVMAAGYQAAFVENLKGKNWSIFEIPRVGIYYTQAHYLSVKLSGLHKPAITKIPN